MPTPKEAAQTESTVAQHLLLLGHQARTSALYTSKRTTQHDPTNPRKHYGQAQLNARFDVKNKASVDPFTAVPTYSQKYIREGRALPDWTHTPICGRLFPVELQKKIERPAAGAFKRRRLELSSVSALPSAEEAFGMGVNGDESGGRNLLERLEALKDEEGEEGGELDDEEGMDEEEQDEVYDDEDAGDYDAENYFDNGDEFGEDYGDADDGEGTY